LEHLQESDWIGFGAAVEWIACRGGSMSERKYSKRVDDATNALVAKLSSLNTSVCERLVRGVPIKDGGKHVSVDSGIWRNVEVGGANYALDKYHLALVDDEDEWAGSVENLNEGWTRLEICTSFIRDNWKPGTLELDPEKQSDPKNSTDQPKGSASVRAMARIFLEYVFAHIPADLTPAPRDEIVKLALERFPDLTRNAGRDLFDEMHPKSWSTKQGPRGPRKPDRKERWKQFRQLMLAADLHN
jgi:hypothetical protein